MKSNTYFLLLLLPWFTYSSQPQPLKIFQKDNRSPLLWAVLQKKDNEVEALLKSGANPNILYLDKPLIHYVIKQGDLQIATLMVNAGADFSGIIDDGQDAFTYVSAHFNKMGQPKPTDCDLMYAMIKNGYDLKANFNNKDLLNNAWYLAIKRGDVNHMGFFLGWGGQRKDDPYPLPIIADANQIFVYSDGSTWTPLFVAIHYFAEHSKAKHVGHGPLGTIAAYGNVNPNLKAKPNGKIESPLSYLLATYPHSNPGIGYIVDVLMGKDGQAGWSHVYKNVYNKATLADGIELFIKNGGSADALFINGSNTKTWNIGWTLLGIAIAYDDVEAVKKLVAAGADVNKRTERYPFFSKDVKNQQMPLEIAFQKSNVAIAEILLEHGARII